MPTCSKCSKISAQMQNIGDIETKSVFHLFDMNKDVLYGTGEHIHQTLFFLMYHKGLHIDDKELNARGSDPSKLGSLTPMEMYELKKDVQDKFSYGESVSDKNYKLNVINLYNSGFNKTLFKFDDTTKRIELGEDDLKQHFESGLTDWLESKNSIQFKPLQDNLARHAGEASLYASEKEAFFQKALMFNEQLANHDRFSPKVLTGVAKTVAEKIEKNKHFSDGRSKTDTDQKVKKGLISGGNAMWEGIRKACKFGTEFFTREGVLHYLVDDIDMLKVVNKDLIESKMPICTSELRYIFRNWKSFEGRLKFYRANLQCLPPWYDNSQDTDDAIKTRQGWLDFALKITKKQEVVSKTDLSTTFRELVIEGLNDAKKELRKQEFLKQSRTALIAFHLSGMGDVARTTT